MLVAAHEARSLVAFIAGHDEGETADLAHLENVNGR